MVAIGTPWVVLWWLGIAGVFVVVIPLVVIVANGVISALREIRDYARDVLEHGVGVAGNLDPVPELGTTRDLTKQIAEGAGRYVSAVEKLL